VRKLKFAAFPLSQYVEYLWSVANTDAAPSRQRVYPNGAMALVIHLKKPTASFYLDDQPQSVRVPLLAGPYSRSFHIDPSESTAVIGVLFRPGAARLFFPVAAHELHNADIALSELNPSEADQLLNEVCSATGEQAQFLVIEEYLKRKLKNAVAAHPAVGYVVDMLSRDGGIRLGQIQRDIGLSHTRINQLFREHVGLTPKLFCRVRRFRMLLERIDRGMPVNWVETATDCGYFDQAHLIHDFRAFAGVTPLQYARTMPA
jgi:AraC-like DNA-binding protein